MAFVVSRWERRDTADREDLAGAAAAWCGAMRSCPGIGRARFYWVGTDGLVTAAEVESFEALDRCVTGEVAEVEMRLGDLARRVWSERWTDPALTHPALSGATTLREALDLP